MTKIALRLLLLTILTAAATAEENPLKPPREIRGVRRLEETTLRLGGVGDNWHMTWAGTTSNTPACATASAFPACRKSNTTAASSRSPARPLTP